MQKVCCAGRSNVARSYAFWTPYSVFLRFLVDYKHLVITIIIDSILLYDISQSNNIGDGSLAKINVFVVTRHFALWVTNIDPPLLLSCILLLDLNIYATSSGLQNKFIVDWLSKSMISLRSSLLLTSCAWLKSFEIRGSNSWFNCVNWNPQSTIWKCEFSSSLLSSDRSEYDSCSCWNCVKYFFVFLNL